MKLRDPRKYSAAKREDALAVLGLLLQFAVATAIAALMAITFVRAIDVHQEHHELTAQQRAAVVARW